MLKLERVKGFTLPVPTDSEEVEKYLGEDGLSVIKSIDNTYEHGRLLHVSVAHRSGYPRWGEILEVKEKFFGDIDCMMMLPKRVDYVNVHPNCFHIWQCPTEWGIK